MKIYVVRHGETVWNKKEVFRGRKDVPLNETGKRQAQLAGRYFSDKDITMILSSPLTRALETAQGISDATGAPIVKIDELTDMDFGIWEGLALKEVEKLYREELDIWRNFPQKFRARDGENLRDVRRRVEKAFQKIPSDKKGSFVLVTHRVLCKVIALLALCIPNNHFWNIRFDPASVSLIEKTGNLTVLSFLNDTCHLRDGGRIKQYLDF
jgi:broad specificity phosphatase PhoE